MTAFSANIAYEDVPANCEFEPDTYVLNADSSNLPVPTATPFNVIEPVILTLPVKECVSSKLSPNLVEPD